MSHKDGADNIDVPDPLSDDRPSNKQLQVLRATADLALMEVWRYANIQQQEIERLTRERDDRPSTEMYLALKADLRRLARELAEMKAERERLTRERDSLLAAVGEHVTVRSDQQRSEARVVRMA